MNEPKINDAVYTFTVNHPEKNGQLGVSMYRGTLVDIIEKDGMPRYKIKTDFHEIEVLANRCYLDEESMRKYAIFNLMHDYLFRLYE